jgi:serpin B
LLGGTFTGGCDVHEPVSTAVDQVMQRVYIGVGEKGTTAAAVTAVATVQSAAMAPSLQIVLDHPFLLRVRDTQTGAILFASDIQDPTAR